MPSSLQLDITAGRISIIYFFKYLLPMHKKEAGFQLVQLIARKILEVMKQLEWEDKDRCYLAFRRLGTIRIMDRISALELLKEDLEGERREEE